MTMARVRRIFLFLLVAFPACIVMWDVSLYLAGGREMTISWAMATAPRVVIFAVGFVAGGTIFGLAAHFWTTMPDPSSHDGGEANVLHATTDELRARLRAEGVPRAGQRFRHYKGADVDIEVVGFREASHAIEVGYRETGIFGITWFRTLAEFTWPVTLGDGTTVPRFRLIDQGDDNTC
jgi:hypothetical protein